ncbi:MAG TPA: PQQ-binding-like beta-propeller repeat protein [Candidatus Bathyarchaeia archaeon]|nr:PQQ-binding-like beta-propeller repeat protein [Candidatus Bathyarchaeia archaeon]
MELSKTIKPSIPILPQSSKILVSPKALSKKPKLKFIVFGILVFLLMLLVAFIRSGLPKELARLNSLPSSYSECMTQKNIPRLESNKLICELYIDEQNKWYEECKKYGKTGVIHVDPGGSESFCNISYRNADASFPSDFSSCDALGGRDTVNFPDKCFIRIEIGSFYSNNDEELLVSQCLSQGGKSDSEGCFIVYDKPLSSNYAVATNFGECESSHGEVISSSFQPKDYYGQSIGLIMIPRCTISYNSVSNSDLFDQCRQREGTIASSTVINGKNSQICSLAFYNLPKELRARDHQAFSKIFENQERNEIENFLYYKDVLIVKVQGEGLYGKDLFANKQVWFYPVEYGDRDIILFDANQTLITNAGVNENIKLVAISLLDGKEQWRFTDSMFYPAYSLVDGNIKLLVSKDGKFVRSLLINGTNGFKIEDKVINESWPTGNTDPIYKNLILKKDFSKVYAVDKTTNEIVWEIELKEGHSSATISLKNIITVNSEDILLIPYEELIYAISPNTGKIAWTYCSRSLFNFAKLDEPKIILEAPDRNLYSVDMSKLNQGEVIDLFPNSLGLSCKL